MAQGLSSVSNVDRDLQRRVIGRITKGGILEIGMFFSISNNNYYSPYECQFCDKKFFRKYLMKGHMAKKH